jgi:hypothetical protein
MAALVTTLNFYGRFIMKNKHTPGPWLYAQEGVTAFNIVNPDGYSVVHLSALLNSTAATDLEANARLIAAAPDMYEALLEFEISQCPRCDGTGQDSEDKKSACTRCAGSGEILHGGWPAHVRAAIKKAARP